MMHINRIGRRTLIAMGVLLVIGIGVSVAQYLRLY